MNSPATHRFAILTNPGPTTLFVGALLAASTVTYLLVPNNQMLGYLTPTTGLLIVFLLNTAFNNWWRYSLIAAVTLVLAGLLWQQPLPILLVECVVMLAQAFCAAWWCHKLLPEDRTITLSIWLKLFGGLILIVDPVAALGAAGLYYSSGQNHWRELSQAWLLRDTVSASVFFTYFLLAKKTDFVQLLRPTQLRYWLAAVPLAGYTYLAFENFTNPFIALALPFTLVALYFPVVQTGFMTWLAIALAWLLHLMGWLQPAADIFHISEPAAALLMSITFIFPAIVGIAMHEARAREEKILGLSERLNLATTSNGLGVWEWDLLQDRLIWDDQMHHLYDSVMPQAEQAPKHWREYVMPEDLPKLEQALNQAMAGEKVTGVDFAVRTKSGRERILHMTATPIKNAADQVIKLVGINSDITEAYYADLLLAEKNRIVELTQKEFALLFEIAPGPLLMVNNQGRIKKANSAAHRLFQYTTLAEENLSRLFPEMPLHELFDTPIIDTASTGEYRREVLALTRQKQTVAVEVRQRLFMLNDEDFLIFSVRDLTEQKQVEATISAAQREAERANAAKSEFIANMSHEIRTPLNAVLGTVKLLQHTQLTDLQLNYLNMVHSAGESLLAILNDILDISKIEAGRMELSPVQFNLEDVLTRLSSIMAINAGNKDLDMAIEVERGLGQVFVGDPQRLQQVLVNLLSNAIKFTERGHVLLRVHQLEATGEQITLEFRVLDTGMGIAPEHQQRLFTAFSQADNSITRRFGGTGLGLLISKRLVEMMGGSIGLRSQAGEGSEFTFSIQLQPGHEDAESATEQPLAVLIVEPVAVVAAALVEYFHSWGWPCDTVSDTQAAMGRLERNSGKTFDCVICGTAINARARMEFLQYARVRLPHAAQVILGRPPMRERLNDQLRQRQIDGVLVQPVTRTQLSSVLLEARARLQGIALQATDPQQTPQHLRGLRVLLVEDNALNQVVARGLLEHYGARVDVAGNGKEAVDQMRQHPLLYQVVLMDVQMPVMDGFTATRMIREELAIDTPILAMSAGVMASEKNRCLQAGMVDFVAKPINVDALVNAILGAVGRPRLGMHSVPSERETPGGTSVFNPDNLLRHVKGKGQRYNAVVEMIRSVLERSCQPVDEAMNALNDGNTDEARRIFHTLKGSMGNLGAMKLWSVAHQLEVATTESADPATLLPLMAELRHAMEEMQVLAQQWLANQKTDPENHPHEKIPEDIHSADWQKDLEQLRALLAQNDLHAFDIYETLRPGLNRQLPVATYRQLDQAVQNLRFAEAETILQNNATLLRENLAH